jgi:PhnB protein
MAKAKAKAKAKATATAKPVPDGYSAVTPYLTVNGAAAALDFYRKVFDAQELMRIPAPDGKIGHAEFKIGNSRIMIADEYPAMGVHSPQSLGGSPVSIYLYVADVDDRVDRAVAAGATLKHAVDDKFYGDRSGSFEDPFGHTWHVATHIEDVALDEVRRRADNFMKQAR